MLSLGLSAQQQQAFHAALASTHSIKIRVQVLDLEHKALADISNQLIGGQVDVDRIATPSRTATLSLSDPEHAIGFDSATPDKAALFLNRMIRIIYAVNAPGLSDWVSVPIFTGPVTSVSRDGEVLQVTAGGKELLAMGVSWTTESWPAGESKAFASRSILHLAGERHFDYMALSERLGSPVSLGPESIPWSTAVSVVLGGNRHMFYDSRGVARLRLYPSATQFTFRTGTGGTITSSPRIDYDVENVKNAVIVKGPIPKGAKTPIRVTMQALPNHPLSPGKLGRHGRPRYLAEVIENDALRSVAEAKNYAQATLNGLLSASTNVEFESLVIPHLEPGDMVRVQTDDFALTTRVETFTIPLTAEETMSVGYHKRVATGPIALGHWVTKPARRRARVLAPPRKKKKSKQRSGGAEFR